MTTHPLFPPLFQREGDSASPEFSTWFEEGESSERKRRTIFKIIEACIFCHQIQTCTEKSNKSLKIMSLSPFAN